MPPERLWSVPLEGDALATLEVGERGQLVVSTSRCRLEPRPGGFDARESMATHAHHNLYAHRSYAFDAEGTLHWEHRALRIVRAAPGGWAAMTDRHDLVRVDERGAMTRCRRLRGDRWRLCGWHAGAPVVTSDPDATWAPPYIYRVRDHQLQRANASDRTLAKTDLPREPFEDACRRDPPPPGMPDSFRFPRHMQTRFHREHLVATHRLHMAWVASITLDGVLVWVRLLDHACCNSACVVDDRIVHASAITVLDADGHVLANRQLPHSVLSTIPDGRGGLCVRGLDGIYGLDAGLASTWSIPTDGIPGVAAHGGILYVVAGEPGSLVLGAYGLA